jgi:hypothetical protein
VRPIKKLSARELRERARDAAACADMLNTDDADDIADWLIDDVIEWLCKNSRVPQFSRSKWDLQLADLRNEFAFGLGGMIAELEHCRERNKMTQIFRVTAKLPPIIVVHGLPGIGKTTFAQNFPDAVFVQTEDGCPTGLEIATFGLCETFTSVIDAMRYLGKESHDHKTMVLDSLDKLEPLILAAVCADRGYASIESPGYGKGWVEADKWWLDFLRGCEWLRRTRGMTIVLIAHSEITTVNDPRVASYTSYQLRLHKRARALVEDSADLVGFLAVDVVIKNEQSSFGKTRARADGGSARWLHLEGRPAFIAKNRYGMPERITIPQRFDYPSTLGKFFPQPQAGATTAAVLETTENVT